MPHSYPAMAEMSSYMAWIRCPLSCVSEGHDILWSIASHLSTWSRILRLIDMHSNIVLNIDALIYDMVEAVYNLRRRAEPSMLGHPLIQPADAMPALHGYAL